MPTRDEDSNNRGLIVYRETWKERLKSLDGDTPLGFPGWDDWDEDGRAKAVRAKSP